MLLYLGLCGGHRLFKPGSSAELMPEELVEQRDAPADAEHRSDGADADAKERILEEEAADERGRHVHDVKIALADAQFLAGAHRQRVNDAVGRVRDEAHTHRHGGTESPAPG